MTSGRPNAEQIDHWNTIAGPKWIAMQPQLDAQLEPYGRAVLEAAAPVLGEKALDVGCGCGATTVALARAVGPTGAVLGIDVSAVMLSRARERVAAEALPQARFELADVQAHEFFPAAFDVALSRFGVMFFEDPVAAFRNVARALLPGGRMAFVCWQSLAKNPWMALPMAAARQHVRVEPPAAPDAPGPFAFADADRLRRILSDAGFAEVELRDFETDMVLGGGASLDEALEIVLRISPVSRALPDAPPPARAAAVDAIRSALAPYERDGVMRMPSSAWLVTARRGAGS